LDERTRVEYYFLGTDFSHSALFRGCVRVWDALSRIRPYIEAHLQPELAGKVEAGAWVSDQVYLAPGAVVEPGAMIKGPTIIGPGTVVRQGAYIREYCLIGANCVVGHATELKCCFMLDDSQAPHFNYVGDSILGRGVNLGAGTKLSNLKNDHSNVAVVLGDQRLDSGLRKFGAIIGDGAALGCNCVTNPGTLIGPYTQVYANAVVRGAVPAQSIVKLQQTLTVVERIER
jgi:NDP-sugar pyrophosphorylase family protein